MRHAGTQEIETERLILRRLTPEDAGMMYTNWANDPQVTKYLRWEPHKNAEETRELLTAWALLYPNGDYYQWGIVEKATGHVFGTIGIFTSSSAEPERDPWPGFDHTNGVWEVGYCIGRAWWNKGFTTEALREVVEYWFQNTDSNWLACAHAFENPASGRVMTRGRLRLRPRFRIPQIRRHPDLLQVLCFDKRTLQHPCLPVRAAFSARFSQHFVE